MSQVGTNLESETPSVSRNGHLNGDAARADGDDSRHAESVHQRTVAQDTDHGPTRSEQAASETAAVCAKFLAELSRQMRTPMSSLLGVAQMLLDTHLTEAQKEFADTVADSVNALTAMAEDIADFSRRLAAGDACLLAHQLELNGNGCGDQHSNGNGASFIAHSVDTTYRGAEGMAAKAGRNGSRHSVSDAIANFTTRVPAETAKLIRILVAEDHITNQKVMLRMLARLGFTADAVANGIEAVAAITRSPYDIILMDCQMPGLDGYEATRQIRRAGGRFGSTPIIAVTANAMAGDREKCLASGMNDYMSKPVLAQTLAGKLEKWILPDAAVGAITLAQSPPTAPSHDGAASMQKIAPPTAPVPAPASAEQAASEPAKEASPAMEASPDREDIGPPVDEVALENLRSMDAGDEGFMAQIIDLFLSDLRERIDALKEAAVQRDGDALKRVAHALKGSCGHFGAAHLAALCRKTEQIGIQQPVGDASAIIREMETEATRVRTALEKAKADAIANSATRRN
jgi:CheY-like chemotaxis protein